MCRIKMHDSSNRKARKVKMKVFQDFSFEKSGKNDYLYLLFSH